MVLSSDGSTGGLRFAFRNAPSFHSLHHPSNRDAEYETNAVLDSYFTHASTPAYVSSRLIQRLVASNPSPTYVEAVATAFTTGS